VYLKHTEPSPVFSFIISIGVAMKKKIIVLLLIVVIILSYAVGKNIVLSSVFYKNNYQLSKIENREIKKVLLKAVKDRCSGIYRISNEIYSTTHSKYIIQFDETAKISKRIVCIIDRSFMESVTQTEDNKYYAIIKVYYPENMYYHFEIEKTADRYLITFFGLDI